MARRRFSLLWCILLWALALPPAYVPEWFRKGPKRRGCSVGWRGWRGTPKGIVFAHFEMDCECLGRIPKSVGLNIWDFEIAEVCEPVVF